MSLNHPFTTIKTPSEVCNFLRELMPENQFGTDFMGKSALRYVWGIAVYFTAHPSTSMPCTVANVAATILQPDQQRVLAMLGSFSKSAELVQHLLTAWQQGAAQLVMGVVSSLQQNLRFLNPAQASTEVAAYLLSHQPLPAGVAVPLTLRQGQYP